MKRLKVFSTVAITALVFILISTKAPTPAKAETGTCCRQFNSLCIVGDHVIRHYYYQASGPCATPPGTGVSTHV